MEIKFNSPSERKRCHQHIREAAREIEDNTPLLETLFHFENGADEETKTGFGWTSLNEPTSDSVRFSGFTRDELTTMIDRVEDATAADLGDPDDDQLVTLAEKLSESGATLRERLPEQSESDQS